MNVRIPIKRRRPVEMPPEFWELPERWTWTVVRVICDQPGYEVDGYRVTLFANNVPIVEVTHSEQSHAQAIACEAAAEIYPAQWKGVGW